MIVDTSALVAILFREPGYEDLIDVLREKGPSGIAAPTLVEAGIVASARLKEDASPLLLALMTELDIAVVPFGEDHARTAVAAWLRFGKGRHTAALNFGDCISYAVSKLAKMPLLCVGADFKHTDLDLA